MTSQHDSTITEHEYNEIASLQSLSSDEWSSDESTTSQNNDRVKNIYQPSPNGPAKQWTEFFNKKTQPKTNHETYEEENVDNEPVIQYQPTFIDGPETDYIYGDDYEGDENVFSAVTQNVNGVKPSAPEDWCITNKLLRKKKTDVKGITETNSDWKFGNIRKNFFNCEKQFDRNCVMESSSSTTRFNKVYQPGGTATILAGQHNGRVTARINDNSGMGRWSGFKLKRSQERNLAILTVYRVSQSSITRLGAQSAYHQQHTILLKKGKKNPQPKQQCITDLQAQIKELQRDNCSIIVMIDANETMDSPHSEMSKMADKCNLLDAHEYRHGINETINTYRGGSTKIDHILVSVDIAPAITKCAVLPFDSVYASDHRPLYVSFNKTQIFQASLPAVAERPKRGIHSTKPKLVAKYTKLVNRQLEENAIYEKITQVDRNNKTTDDWPELETIDQQLSDIVIATEQKIQTPSLGPWSPPIEYNTQPLSFDTGGSGIETDNKSAILTKY
jgi:hypothetical protein